MKGSASIRMSTERLRHVLTDIEGKDLDMQVCPGRTYRAPGEASTSRNRRR
ncbi:MAG: hypothetical protein VCF24_25025 [Candidatus Latescibacterota bacterium]